MVSNNDHTDISGQSNKPSFEMLKHIMVDIDIESNSEDLDTRGWIIYRVPHNLRSLNEDAYTPQLVSIGPLHYGKTQLLPMQKHKLRYLHFFQNRLEGNVKYMDKFKEYLKSHEQTIRDCYAENLCDNIDKEKLVEIMLLDSVFIMELFLRISRQKLERKHHKSDALGMRKRYLDDNDDIILKRSWLNKNIQRDLILLENQIPMFILQELYQRVVPDSDPFKKKHLEFIELAHDYFCNFSPNGNCCFYIKEIQGPGYQKSNRFGQSKNCNPTHLEAQHFTDLKRFFYVRLGHSHRQKGPLLKTATKLQDAGVSFERAINRPLLDIRFQKYPILSWFLCLACIPKFKMFEARLEIPQLTLTQKAECAFRNIMAFEQCHYPDEAYVCDYIAFFDSLMRTKEDVNLLVEAEIIEHTLSDMEVQTLVHDLCRNIETNETCYRYVIVELHRYYKRMWWNRNMATLRLVYFRDLWRVSSTIIGVVVFMFTLLNIYQTIRDFNKVKK